MKKRRSFAALLLVCTMLSSMICLPATAAGSGGTVTKVYGQNFDGFTKDTANTKYADATATYSGSEVYASHADKSRSKITAGITNAYATGNLQRHYLQKTSGAVYFPMSGTTYVDADMAYTNEGASADLYLDFDFYMEASVTQDRECFILGDSGVMGLTTPQAMGEYAYVNVAAEPVDAASGKIRIATAYDSENQYTYQDVNDATYSMKTWNHLTIVVHATDESAAKGTYDVYLNGSKILDGQALMTNTAANEARGAIRVFAVAAKGKNGATSEFCDMDNLYAYKTQNETLGNNGEILSKISDITTQLTIAKNTGALDADAYNEYTENVEACMNFYKAALGNGYTATQFAIVLSTLKSIESDLNELEIAVKPGGYLYQNTYEATSASFYDDTYGIGTHNIDGYTVNAKREMDLITVNELPAGMGLEVAGSDAVINDTTYNAVNEGADAKMIFEFDLYTHLLRETKSDLTIRVAASERVKDAFNGLFNVKIKGEDGLIYRMFNNSTYTYDNASTTYTTPLEDNRWYRIRIEIRATTAEGNASGQQTMYVDGQKVFENAMTATKSLAKHGELNTLTLVKEANAEASVNYGPRIYVDNVSAYKANSENPVTANSGSLIAAIREAELYAKTTKEYSDATLKWLEQAIAGAKTVAEKENLTDAEVASAVSSLKKYISAMKDDAKADVTLQGFAFEDADGNRVYEAVSGGKLTGVYLSKNAIKDGADDIYLAVYRNDILEKVEVLHIPQETTVGDTVLASVDNAMEVDEIDGCTVSAFVFDGAELYPVTKKSQGKVSVDKSGATVFLIGDSTVCDYTDAQYPQKGWGQMLSAYFDTTKIEIDNRAVSGESTKSFLNKYWQDVLDDINSGDYVFIQFGHNDQKPSTALYANSATEYQANLKRYIADIREKGATPILFTPPARALSTDNVFVGAVGHRDYPQAVKKVAEECGVLLIDLLNLQCEWVEEQEYSEIKKDMWLYVDVDDPRYVGDSAFAESQYKTTGVSDSTHFSVYGADVLAKLVTDALKDAKHPLANYMKEHTPEKKA